MLIRWTSKPLGMAGISALACVTPATLAAHLAIDSRLGFYGTQVSGTTIGRPEARGGGTG